MRSITLLIVFVNLLTLRRFMFNTTVTGKASTVYVPLNFTKGGPKHLVTCGPLPMVTPSVPESIPIDILYEKTVLKYTAVQQITTPSPQVPHSIDTGMGVVPLLNGGFISMNRRLPYGDGYSNKRPHMTMQMLHFTTDDHFPLYGSECMFLYGSDVRIFTFRGQVYGYTHLRSIGGGTTDILIYNVNTGRTVKLVVNQLKNTFMAYGKNWMPFEYHDTLFFIHGLDPSLTIVKVGDMEVSSKYAATQVGNIPIVYCDLIRVNNTRVATTDSIHRRGSTPAFTSGNVVWGVGHISKIKDPENENRGSQIPFFWKLNMETRQVEYVDMEIDSDYGGHKRYIYPMSLFVINRKLFMTAVDSYSNWFRPRVSESPFPLSEVRNTVYEITSCA
jgi:hypothetical protein